MAKCEIIQDLLPLYVDDVASEGSRAEIDEHIKACPNCREVLAKMQSGGTPRLSVDKAEIGAFKIMKRKLLRKNLIIACVSIICTIALICGVFVHTSPLPFDPNRMSVNLAYDQVIDITYDGGSEKRTTSMARYVDDSLYYGYSSTLWTRLFNTGTQHAMSIGNSIIIATDWNGGHISLLGKTENEIDTAIAEGATPTINRVYYMDYRKIMRLDDEAFKQAAKDAVLIWER